MRRNTLILLTATALLVPTLAWAQGRNSLEGVWQATELRITGPNAGTISSPQPRLLIFTDGYYSFMGVFGAGPRVEPDGFPATASADQLRAVWGRFAAHAGPYDVEAWLLTLRQQVSNMPTGMGPGEFATFAYALTPDGNTLTTTSDRTEDGPVENPITIIYSRVE